MDIATAIATLNRLLTSKEPAQFNSSWIRRHAPRCYRFIQVNFRREYDGIDWDRLTCALERRFQRLWKPERITKRSLYEEPHEIDAVREKFREKMYVFIAPLEQDRHTHCGHDWNQFRPARAAGESTCAARVMRPDKVYRRYMDRASRDDRALARPRRGITGPD